MSFIKAILGFCLVILIAGFCILNAQMINVIWSPLHEAYPLPLYAVLIATLTIGFLTGAITVWFNGAKIRKSLRESKKTIRTLEKELGQVEKEIAATEPDSTFFPILKNKN